jgi:hypothetical protein
MLSVGRTERRWERERRRRRKRAGRWNTTRLREVKRAEGRQGVRFGKLADPVSR